MGAQIALADKLKDETLAAAYNCRRHLMLLRRRQNEHHHRRWLFDRLQKGVECLLREHMAFVNDIELVSAALSDKRRPFDQRSRVVDTVIGCRIDLKNGGRIA